MAYYNYEREILSLTKKINNYLVKQLKTFYSLVAHFNMIFYNYNYKWEIRSLTKQKFRYCKTF